MKTHALGLLIGLAAALVGCGDNLQTPTCGAGTVDTSEGCAPDPASFCGPGTIFRDGVCESLVVPEDDATGSDDVAILVEEVTPEDIHPPVPDELAGLECVPSCTGRACGDDGCGGTCGSCDGGVLCNGFGQCVPTAWTCDAESFGSGLACDCACGAADPDCDVAGRPTIGCDAGEVCKDGACGACEPQCGVGKAECGDDGCGGSCGRCWDPQKPICAAGECVDHCEPRCEDRQCGPDGCGGTCGACGAGTMCVIAHCEPLPDALSCAGKCGEVTAGGCSCEAGCGSSCCGDMVSACQCVPECDGKQCGDDGCGGSCGGCDDGEVCSAGACVDDPCAPNPCTAHGTCDGGACVCELGFDGPTCGECGHGLTGYPSCHLDPCLGETCSGHGTCDSATGQCECAAGVTGPTCDQCSDPRATWPECVAPPACGGNGCSGHGTCVGVQCVCAPGFAGEDCEACSDPADAYPSCGAPSNYGVDPEVALVSCPFCGQSLAGFSAPFDAGDVTPPTVKVAIPPDGSIVPPGVVFTFLLDDVVAPSSVTPSTLKLTPQGSAAAFAGSVVMQESVTGNTLLMFFPSNLAYSGPVTVTLDGLTDDGGNALPRWQSTVTLGDAADNGFEGNLGFEHGTFGCVLAGDAGASSGSAEMTPSEGDWQLALTTHDTPTVGGAGALDAFSSAAVCGPFLIPPGKTKLTFDYDFASSEFDEWVGQSYDDLGVVVLSGPRGGTGGIPVSVNSVAGATATTAYGLPDGQGSDGVAKRSGRATASFSGVDHLGGWATLTFIVTDVADPDFSSVLTIDHVRFE